MHINHKIYYLHYVLCFIDDKFKICNTVDETFCNSSITGENIDSFLYKNGNSYQFSLCNGKCYIQLLGTNNLASHKEKLWMKPFLRDYLDEIHKFDDHTSEKFFIKRNIDSETYIIFYIRELDIKIKMELYERIINDPFNYTKQYTSTDLFFIIHSHAFTILDNQFHILKNILFLITLGSFKIEDINQIFLHFITEKNTRSSFLKKFNDMNITTIENDLLSKIKQFLEINYNFQSRDDFLSDLHLWKCTIANMFILIQNTFYFHIKSDGDSILKIYNDINAKSGFDILFNDFNVISCLIDKNCIFSFKFASPMRYGILTCLCDNEDMDKIHIDITELLQKLYQYNDIEIIDESVEFHYFLEMLIMELQKPLVINVGVYQFMIQKDLTNIEFIKPNRKQKNEFFFDVIIFLCQKINILDVENPFKFIAKMIYEDFFKQDISDIQKVTIGNYNNSLCITNNHIKTVSKLYKEKKNEDTEFEQFETSIPENKIIIVYESDGIMIWHQPYLEGIIDLQFTLLIPEVTSHKGQFVSRIKDFLNLQCIRNYNDELYQTKYFDSFQISANQENQIIINVFSKNSHNSLLLLSKKHVHSLKNNNHKTLKPDTYNVESIFNIEIYHYERSFIQYLKSYQSQMLNLRKSLIGITRFNLSEFETESSNFHFIFEQLLELKSIDKNLSRIKKQMKNSSSNIDIEYCMVKFLPNSYLTEENIIFHNCIIESIVSIQTNIFSRINHYIKFENSSLNKYIILFNFLWISACDLNNVIQINKQNLHIIVELSNCKIKFFKDVPNNIVEIILDNCEIEVENNLLYFEKNIYIDETENFAFSTKIVKQISHFIHREINVSLLIQNSTLPENLQIYGIFHAIRIENCISSFNLNAYTHILKIKNHRGQFTIEKIIKNAFSKYENNTIKKYGKYFRIENYELNILQNLKVERLIIKNCLIKNIRNIKFKRITIENTDCAFELINRYGQNEHFQSDSLNLKISLNAFMTIQKF